MLGSLVHVLPAVPKVRAGCLELDLSFMLKDVLEVVPILVILVLIFPGVASLGGSKGLVVLFLGVHSVLALECDSGVFVFEKSLTRDL